MFGYVRPVAAELLVKEHELYRATYCGVCRCMKKYTGALSNSLHSYDSVFLALVRMLYIDSSAISASKRSCIAHPLKKRVMLDENPALEYTARAFGILTYYKLCDDISDERLTKRLSVSLIRPIFASARRKAGLLPLCEIAKDRLERINALEREGVASVDKSGALFGELLGEIFAFGMDEKSRGVLYSVGYHLGKFIYAADAAEDYDEDRKRGRYNPYRALYGDGGLTDENRAMIKCALLLECRALEAAVCALPFGDNVSIENILKNIIYVGLPDRIAFLDKASCTDGTKGRK
ncbi:MAG: hypothetical protein J6L90_00735 [Clostridia bacterium]|nr:hypothetical protein [Clostridia bacterium]